MNKSLAFILYSILLTISFFAMSCNNGRNADSKGENKSNMKKSGMDYITLINSFEVPAGKLEESIIYWEACRDFLKEQPGYISTKLHQSIKDDARFQLVNVALWETPQAFMNASNKMRKDLGLSPPEGLKPNASLYDEIRK